jgi:hypothetical protein
MGQTSDPETLVLHQKPTPGNNPEDFMQKIFLSLVKIIFSNFAFRLKLQVNISVISTPQSR